MKTLAKQMEALQGRLDIQVKTNDMLLDRLRLQTKIIETYEELDRCLSGMPMTFDQIKDKHIIDFKLRLKIAELKNEIGL